MRLAGLTQLASGRARTPIDLGLSNAAWVTSPSYFLPSLIARLVLWLPLAHDLRSIAGDLGADLLLYVRIHTAMLCQKY